jgi:DNA-binding CsgD family transcriptional regulator
VSCAAKLLFPAGSLWEPFGLVLANVAFAVVTIQFGRVIALLTRQQSLVILSFAMVIIIDIIVVIFVQQFFQDNLIIALASLPVFVGLLLSAKRSSAFVEVDEPEKLPQQRAVLPFMLLVISLGYILCSILSGVTSQLSALSLAASSIMYAFSGVIAFIVLVFFLRLRQKTKTSPTLYDYWPLSIILLALGLLSFSLELPIGREVMFSLAFACLNVFYFGSLLLAPVLIYTYRFPFIPTFGVFTIVCYGYFWGRLGNELVNSGLGFFSIRALGALTILFFLVCMVVVAQKAIRQSSSSTQRSQSYGSDVPNDNPKEKIDELFEQKGLTAREQEICHLLLQGYSASKIAAKLFISENTVHFHQKNAYRKFDIHSKQDLREIVDERLSN